MTARTREIPDHNPQTGEVVDYGDGQMARVEVVQGGMVALNKSEWEAQLDAAHKYKRSVSVFMKELRDMATISVDIAESCIYALPRDGKTISGPSVRFAEMAAHAWGNLHIGARIVGIEDKDIIAQGVAIDLEKNVRFTMETRRRITKRDGTRYGDDMIVTTGNAAASIALRNAIFRVVPRAFISPIYEEVQKVATGDAKTLATRRATVLGRLALLGADEARVLLKLGVKGVEDIGQAMLKDLIGFGTSIKDGSVSVDDCFPAAAPAATAGAPEGTRMSLNAGPAPAPTAAPAAPATVADAPPPAAASGGSEPPAPPPAKTAAEKRAAIEAEFKRLDWGKTEQRSWLEDQAGVGKLGEVAEDALDDLIDLLGKIGK